MPRVSVIVPAYNQGRYLGEAIRSALGQTCADLEVIVVDDGSTDDTPAVCRAFTDPRLRYVWQVNQGLSAARNTGIRQAHGAFLTYLDSDDLFQPDKVQVLLGAFERDERVGFAHGYAILIDEEGKPIGERFERDVPGESSEWLLRNPLHVGSVMVRREWQERIGFFDESLRSSEDWDMWLRLALAGCPMQSVRHPVSRYRFHRMQMTRIGRQMTTATFAVLDKTFANPNLPETWRARRDHAYSRAHLRAAAQAYTAREYRSPWNAWARPCAGTRVSVRTAVHRWHASPRAGRITRRPRNRWLSCGRCTDHLPPELATLRRRRRRELSREALHLANAARSDNDDRATRALALEAVGLAPRLFFNRDVLSMLIWPSRGGRRPERPASGDGPIDSAEPEDGGRESAGTRTEPINGELVD